MTKTKLASKIIEHSCCGQLLEVPVFKIVEKVQKLEADNESLKLLAVVLAGVIGFLLVVICQ